MAYTHELNNILTIEEFNILWAANKKRVWDNKAYPEILWDHYGVTTEEEAKTLLYNRTTRSHDGGFHHLIYRDGTICGLRVFTPMNPLTHTDETGLIEQALGPWWRKTTMINQMAFYVPDDSGTSDWIIDIDVYRNAGVKEKMESLGFERWFAFPSGKIQKIWFMNKLVDTPWIGTYVDDNTTPLYYLGPFGWPEDFGQIGAP